MEKPELPAELTSLESKQITDSDIISIIYSYSFELSKTESEDKLAELLESTTAKLQILLNESNLEDVWSAITIIGKTALSASTRISAKNTINTPAKQLQTVSVSQISGNDNNPRKPLN